MYSKSGFNLFYNLELNPLEILTGKEATIDLYHSKIKVNIPSCVDINKQMRVKGKGFKTRRGFGDLLGFKQSGIKNFKLADPIHNNDLFLLAEKEMKRIEESNEDISKFKPLIKLYDRADIINDIA